MISRKNFEQQFDYRPKWIVIFMCAAFFGLCAAILWHAAVTNDRGIILNGLIEFSTVGATRLLWLLFACSLGFIVLAGCLVYHRLRYRQQLAFGPEALCVPRSRWSREVLEIPYKSMHSLSESIVGWQRFLYVHHAAGKYTINASMLPSKAAYADVAALLARKMSAR
jgi:hypothetical protein